MDSRNIRFTILAVMIFVAASAGCETMTLGDINIEFDGVGYLVGMEMQVKIPLSGYEKPYLETLLEGQY